MANANDFNPAYQDYLNTAAAQSVAYSSDGAFNWITKGIPSAAIAGVTQVWNSIDWAAGKLAKAAPWIDDLSPESMRSKDLSTTTADNIRRLLGEDSTIGGYYGRHSEGAEIGGTVLGSLATGGFAVKGVGLLQAGLAGKLVTPTSGLFTGLVTNTLEAKYAIKAAEALASGTSTAFARISASAAAAGQGVIEGVAFELGAMAAFHQSPMYDKVTDVSSAVTHLLTSGAIFGAGNAMFKYAGFMASDVNTAYGVTEKLSSIKNRVGESINRAIGFTDNVTTTALNPGDALVSTLLAKHNADVPLSDTVDLTAKFTNQLAATKKQVLDTETLKQWTTLAGAEANYAASSIGSLPPEIQYQILSGATKVSRPSSAGLSENAVYVNTASGASGQKADILFGDMYKSVKFAKDKPAVLADGNEIALTPFLSGYVKVAQQTAAESHATFKYAFDKLEATVAKLPKGLDTIIPDKTAMGSAFTSMGNLMTRKAAIEASKTKLAKTIQEDIIASSKVAREAYVDATVKAGHASTKLSTAKNSLAIKEAEMHLNVQLLEKELADYRAGMEMTAIAEDSVGYAEFAKLAKPLEDALATVKYGADSLDSAKVTQLLKNRDDLLKAIQSVRNERMTTIPNPKLSNQLKMDKVKFSLMREASLVESLKAIEPELVKAANVTKNSIPELEVAFNEAVAAAKQAAIDASKDAVEAAVKAKHANKTLLLDSALHSLGFDKLYLDHLAELGANRTARDYLTKPLPYTALAEAEAQYKILGQFKLLNQEGKPVLYAGDDALGVLALMKSTAARELSATGVPMESIANKLNVSPEWLRHQSVEAAHLFPPIKPLDTRQYLEVSYDTTKSVSVWDVKAAANLKSRLAADAELHRLFGTNILGADLPKLDMAKFSANEDNFNGWLTTTNSEYNSVLEKAAFARTVAVRAQERMATDRAAKFLQSEQKLRALGDESVEAKVIAALHNRVRSSPDKYTLDPTGVITRYSESIANGQIATEVLSIKDLVTKAFAGSSKPLAEEAAKSIEANVLNYLKVHIESDAKYMQLQNTFRALQGKQALTRLSNEIYFPAKKATDRSHVALVLSPEGDKAMIQARDKAGLDAKIKGVTAAYPEYKILTKSDTDIWFKSLGEYDAEAAYQATKLDGTLLRSGVLADIPTPHGIHILDDLNAWYSAKEHYIIKSSVESVYKNELHSMELSAKTLNPGGQDNAYTKLRDTLLGNTTPTKWSTLQSHITGAIDSSLSNLHQAWKKTSTGQEDLTTLGSRESGNLVFSAFNGKNAWESSELYNLAGYQSFDGTTKAAIYSVNKLHRTFQLGLDYFTGIVNAIGTPILLLPEIKSALNADPKFGYFTMIGEAIKNYFQKPEMLSRMDSLGVVNKSLTAHRELLDATSVMAGAHSSQAALAAAGQSTDKFNKVMDFLSTPTNFSEQFTRYIAADVGLQIATKRGLVGAEADAFMLNFTNKVSANFTTGQRAKLFDGALGSSLGMYMSYQLNYMQQVFRRIAEGDKKTAAMIMAMQGTVFGAKSLPFFDFLNKHLVTSLTDTGGDTELATRKMLGDNVSNYLMYGLGSNLLGSNLWSRGGVTPRNTTLVPLNPTDLATVSQSIKYYESLAGFTQSMLNGGSLKVSALEAIAHASIARPITGLAELALGAKVSAGGTLDYSLQHDKLSVASAIRLLGARPMDEAITLEQYYKFNQIQVSDKEKRTKIANALRSQIMDSEDDVDFDAFAEKYSKAGGNPREFRQFYLRNLKEATTPRAVLMAEKLRKSPYADSYQRMVQPDGLENYDPRE